MRRPRRRALIAALSALLALPAAAAPRAEAVGGWRWELYDADFGGFSGLELSADGSAAIVLSDRGTFRQGRLARSPEGAITAARFGPAVRLLGPSGRPLTGNEANSEGLALAPSGRLYVSLERDTRILAYPRPGARPSLVATPRELARLPPNQTLEALAIDPSGDLWTIPEALPASGPLALYRRHAGRWTAYPLPSGAPFRPVGADFGPDGRLYLLERRFSPIGFQSRIRRFAIGPAGPGAPEPLVETPWGAFDNLEGLAAWRDGLGRIHLTAVSDDNFSPLQVTEFVDFLVRE